eukprot:m.212850 g.212850  ORF g.212850 m.212850 type:complete len:326 (-) comp21769_c0_seq1:187-1164(-)
MAEKLLLLLVVVAASLLALARADPVVCDFDPEAECPEGNSCCPSDITSCCPLPQATCCVDNQHCCPQGTQCLPGGNCQYVDHTIVPATRLGLHNGNVNGFKKSNATKTAPAPAATEQENNNNNKYKKLEKSLVSALLNATNSNHECPDQRSQCSDSNTCCLLSHGGYGCCALPNAVCCSDNIHCCPAGYFCLSGGTCGDSPALAAAAPQAAAAASVTASRKQTKAQRIGRPQRRRPQQPQQSQQQEKLSKVVCPNGQACPDGATCCPAPSGGYGCCGLPNAVCCSDRIHCCPYGTTCDGDNCVTNDASVSSASRKRFHAKMFWQP